MKKSKDKMTLRFNLGRGSNYKKWKIKTRKKDEYIYLDPSECALKLIGCRLYNNREQSNKIYEGGHKKVCSWIECDEIVVMYYSLEDIAFGEQIHYNPRKHPYWVDNKGNNLDGMEYDVLITNKNKVYIKNEQ